MEWHCLEVPNADVVMKRLAEYPILKELNPFQVKITSEKERDDHDGACPRRIYYTQDTLFQPTTRRGREFITLPKAEDFEKWEVWGYRWDFAKPDWKTPVQRLADLDPKEAAFAQVVDLRIYDWMDIPDLGGFGGPGKQAISTKPARLTMIYSPVLKK